MELGYTKQTKKSFEEALADVERLTADKGFRVLHVHDVQATLAEKGFETIKFKIVEICNAKFAHKALGISPLVGLFMPCKINIYTQGEDTVISGMRPAMISEFFQQQELKELAFDVDKVVRSIVDDAC